MPDDMSALDFHDFAPVQESFRDALVEGLSQPSKSIPCRFLYDAQGSILFDAICELDEYYPTRTELSILNRHAPEIAAHIGPHARLIEFGASSSQKVRIILAALDRPDAYVPVDVSQTHLRQAAQDIAKDFPDIQVVAIAADYTQPFVLPEVLKRGDGRRFGFFPGSTIGNLTAPEALDFLSLWAHQLGAGGGMVVGVDLQKDASVLEAAYNDAKGVTANFSRNLLARANRELAADFDLARFRHDAHYNTDKGRIEIHLQSLADQDVQAAGRSFHFGKGEKIHTEYSYKYTLDGFRALARDAGFEPVEAWTDPDQLFSVHYLQAPG
jgi:L-histidine N-alpha-methyltransferase